MKKAFIYALLICVFTSLFTGCGGKTPMPGLPEEKILRWISSGADSSINPHDSAAVANFEIVDLIQSSLYDWAPSPEKDKAVLIPCMAEGEPVSEDGYTWIIKVSPDAKWANGEPINAHTFIYSWRMGLDPGLGYTASIGIANQYVEVTNAYEYYSRQTDEWDSVGLKAIDDYTLEITTVRNYTANEVMRHFATRATSPVYEPLYESGMNESRTNTNYGTDLKYFMGSGAFNLVTWVKASERVFVKNENFINSDMIKLDGITCRVVVDEATRIELFESGGWDYVELGVNGLTKYAEAPNLTSYDLKTVRTIEVNRNNPEKNILNDQMFRKALYYATDRAVIAKLTNSSPAPYFISTIAVAFEDGTAYRSEEAANSWLPESNGYNPELAKKYFDQVMEKHGLETLDLTLVYSEEIAPLRAASEYVQAQWKLIFGKGFGLNLRSMPHTAALALMRTSVSGAASEWDLCWSGWNLAAETFEAHSKFAPYQSTAPNRYTNYSNDFLDEKYPLFSTDEYRLDSQKVFALTVEIEKSIVLDDVTCIPVFQEKNFVLFSPRVRLAVNIYAGVLGYGWKYCDLSLQ